MFECCHVSCLFVGISIDGEPNIENHAVTAVVMLEQCHAVAVVCFG